MLGSVKSSARVVGMLHGATTTMENWQFSMKLNVCAFWPGAPFLGIYTREMFIYVPKTNNSRKGTRVTVAALLPLAQTGNMYLSAGGWTDKFI